MNTSGDLRSIPAVDRILDRLSEQTLPRPLVVAAIREELRHIRRVGTVPDLPVILENLQSKLAQIELSRIQPIVNGTGILANTNLGRVPLARSAIKAVQDIAGGYSNLELDLGSGKRGSRGSYLEACLARLCHAEAATVVNNCAAALVLMLRHFTSGRRKEVIISRGELIQIGGGFRIPEILGSSGAVLREVGTTNRTDISDYSGAIGSETGLILRVHRSNFFMAGFVKSPTTQEVANLAKRRRIPFVEDLGSGSILPTETLAGLEHEPTPAEVIKEGAILVCFSGDKLFGGPQAGIIAGKRSRIGALKREPFFRALRCDKLILSALQATVEDYLDHRPADRPDIPLLKMLSAPNAELSFRAEHIATSLKDKPVTLRIGTGKARVGGGALPQSFIGSVTIEMVPEKVTVSALAARLRKGKPPVLGRLSGGSFKIDLRTVFKSQDGLLIAALSRALE